MNRTVIKAQLRKLDDRSVVEVKMVVFHTPGKLPLEVVQGEYDLNGYEIIGVEERALTPGFSIQVGGPGFNRGYTMKGDRDGKATGIRDEVY